MRKEKINLRRLEIKRKGKIDRIGPDGDGLKTTQIRIK